MSQDTFATEKRCVEWIKDSQGTIRALVDERLNIIEDVVGISDITAWNSGQDDDEDRDKFSHIADKVYSRLCMRSRIYSIGDTVAYLRV